MGILSENCDLNMIIMKQNKIKKNAKVEKSIDSPKWWNHFAAFLGGQRSTLEDF